MTDAQQYAQMDPYGTMPPDEPAANWRSWRTKGAWANWKSLPRVWPFLRPYRFLYVTVIVFMLLGAAIALAEPWPLALMIDNVLDHHNPTGVLASIVGSDPNVYTLLVIIVIAGFTITIIGHGMEVVNGYVSAKLEQNMILDLRSRLFDNAQRLSLAFHDERHTGQLMSLINMQANSVGEIVMAFPPIMQNMLTLVGMLVIALLIDWQVTLIALVAVPMIYYASALYGTRIVPRIRQVMRLEWGSLSIVYEAMSMLRVIVSFGRERHEHRRFRSQGQTAVDARVRLTVRQTLFSLGVTAATALGTALVLGFGASHVLNGEISKGEMLVLIGYIASVYQPLESIGAQIGHLHQHFVFLSAAMLLFDAEPEVKEAPDAVDIGRARGEITLENLTFAYQDRPPAVKGVSFAAEAGQRIAIVGPTGAGKTTIVNLLVRFYDPKEGAIKIDGVDIRKLKLHCLRENISVVLQEPMLFSGTIAENIRYGRLDATSKEIIGAAKKANAHDFISKLPKGYETELGEGGQQLSGGERQRICVARAFVKNAPILILDEPTSSIDSKTENVILDALDELMIGRTSIMIAHRLSTIRDADVILVMNHGELVEHGSHDELIAMNGLYSQLYEAQTRIRSRSRTEGGAAHEDTLIDSITQEVGDRVHAAADNGAPPAQDGDGKPPSTSPPVERPAAPPVESKPVAPHEQKPPPERHVPREQPTPPQAPTQPPGEPPARLPEPVGEPLEVAAMHGAHDGSDGNGRPDHADGNGRRRVRVGFEAVSPNGHNDSVSELQEHNDVVCGFCQRTLLKGENAEPFIAPYDGRRRRRSRSRWDSMPDAGLHDMFSLRRGQGADLERKLVCELCWELAEEAGWAPLQVMDHET
jgi:ABC-type multidrug transport system fused ATPase/permease subunit